MDDKKFQDLMKDLYNERKKYKDKINKIPDGYEKHILSEITEMKRKAREKKLRRIMGEE